MDGLPHEVLKPVTCGALFLDAATVTRMTSHFGLFDCLRYQHTNTWLVVGTNLPVNGGATRTPGGAMIAAEVCPAGDAACLDANTPHSLSAFTVTYPPNPEAGRLEVQAILAGNLLLVADHCGRYLFQIQSQRWYVDSDITLKALQGGDRSLNPVRTPPPVAALEALRTPAPAAAPGSCPS